MGDKNKEKRFAHFEKFSRYIFQVLFLQYVLNFIFSILNLPCFFTVY